MEIHYFQRYSLKENVVTNNTMLLIQRLYYFSQEKFGKILTKMMEKKDNDFNVNIQWFEQTRNKNSVPDAQIRQNSFNILVETKLNKNFDINQIDAHIKSFDGTDKYQIMLTLSPYEMDKNQEEEIQNMIKDKENTYHIHITFEKLIQLIDEEIDKSKDYEFYEILSDYERFCSEEGILNNAGNLLRVVPTGASFDNNIKFNIYYDKSEHGYTEHNFIGLYINKEVRKVGEIKYIVDVNLDKNEFKKIRGEGEITETIKNNIIAIINLTKETNGWNIDKEHRFFIVDRFYDTSFKKISKGGIMGKLMFNIESEVGKKVESAEELANELRGKEWT